MYISKKVGPYNRLELGKSELFRISSTPSQKPPEAKEFGFSLWVRFQGLGFMAIGRAYIRV